MALRSFSALYETVLGVLLNKRKGWRMFFCLRYTPANTSAWINVFVVQPASFESGSELTCSLPQRGAKAAFADHLRKKERWKRKCYPECKSDANKTKGSKKEKKNAQKSWSGRWNQPGKKNVVITWKHVAHIKRLCLHTALQVGLSQSVAQKLDEKRT